MEIIHCQNMNPKRGMTDENLDGRARRRRSRGQSGFDERE